MGSKPNSVQLVAVDDGYLQVKLARFDDSGEITTMSLPSRAERGVSLRSMDGMDVGAYRTDGDLTWTVAPEIKGETTRTEDYPTSSLLRVLVHHALIQGGYGGKTILLATGLPVASFYAEGGVNKSLIEQKKANLAGTVTPLDQSVSTAKVVAQRVYPQAIMAYTDHVLDAAGNLIDGRKDMRVGVVDVGGRTTDYAVVMPDNKSPVVDMHRSGSVDIGVLNIIDALRPALLTRFGVREISDSVLSEVVRTGKLRAYGKEEDASAELAKASHDVAERVAAEAQRRFESGFDLDVILYVGGGAEVLSKALSQYKHVHVAENPHAANARGLLKYIAYVDKEGREIHQGNASLRLIQGGNGD